VETSLQVLFKQKNKCEIAVSFLQTTNYLDKFLFKKLLTRTTSTSYFKDRCKTQSVNQRNVIDACNEDRYGTTDGVPQDDRAVSV